MIKMWFAHQAAVLLLTVGGQTGGDKGGTGDAGGAT